MAFLDDYRIATILADVNNDDGTAPRSSPHFPLARRVQKVFESGLFANLGNQLIELLADFVMPPYFGLPG